MATFVLNDCFVSIAGTERSSWISSVTLQIDVAEGEVTNFTSAGWTVPIGAKKSGSLALTFNQDMAASQVDATLWPLLGTTVAFVVRADRNSAKGAGNPEYSGSFLMNGWSPVSGTVGDTATVSVTFPLSGAVTRST